MRYEPPRSPLLRAMPLMMCCVGALLLWAWRPPNSKALLQGAIDPGTATCLSNLGQISKAYALYARDYDGKIPPGADPEDRYHPEIWDDRGFGNYNGALLGKVKKIEFQHVILRPYVSSGEVFHCPADDGWMRSRLPTLGSSSLINVKPSSFAKFGTSYYVFTKFGLAENRADDFDQPGRVLLMFDGDLWHVNANQELLNGLFADGHAQNLTAKEFDAYSRNG